MIGTNFPYVDLVLYVVVIIFGAAIAYALTVIRRLPPKRLTLRLRRSTRCRAPSLSELNDCPDERKAA